MKFVNLFSKKEEKEKIIYNAIAFKNKDKNDYRLRTKLILMLDGDWKKADELIGRARFCDPGITYSYYCHKAIINYRKNKKAN